MLLPKLARQSLQGPLYLLLIPIVLYYFLDHYATAHYWRDPTSPYFDASRAYTRMYSNFRSQEADAFVQTSANATFHRSRGGQPLFCVGMLTVARPNGAIYFRTSLASLVAGLTQEERDTLYIMPFITHTDPSQHPAYGEAWLNNVADRVLEYDKAAPNYQHIKDLEADREKTGQPDREKHLLDYTYLLKTCSATGANFVLMMEDDVLALDGWYHRAYAALHEVDRRTRQKGAPGLFYLRLFYTEKLLTWESPGQQASYRRWWLAGTFLVTLASFAAVRKYTNVKRNLVLLFIVTYASLAVYIGYFFYNGHHSMLPIPKGVNHMSRAACCAQGIIYPHNRIEMLVKHYEKEGIGFVDTLAEKLADERPLETGPRWALTPSPMQHIGGQSSKGDNWGSDKPGEMSEAQRLWNFAFELNDPQQLKKEHEEQAMMMMVRIAQGKKTGG